MITKVEEPGPPVHDEAMDHFYGTDMGIRDPFGSAIRIPQPAMVGHKVTA